MAAMDPTGMLHRCDSYLLNSGSSEPVDERNTGGMLFFLKDNRRAKKVLWRHLFVLGSLLEGLNSARQLLVSSCPPITGETRDRWKSLKLECKKKMEVMENALTTLNHQTTQMQKQQHKLQNLLQQLNAKKDQSELLYKAVLETKAALRLCEGQLEKLQEKSEVVHGHMTSWQLLRDDLQESISANQEALQIRPLSMDQSEQTLQLLPRSLSSSRLLEPLKVSITWSPQDRFQLQLERGAGLVEESVTGLRGVLSAALLEVRQSYASQADLLTEIQELRSSFAIDWSPRQRRLVCLMPCSLVCQLSVDEGYPSRGHAHLLSVSRHGCPVDTTGLQPPGSPLSLTQWLLRLNSLQV